MDTNRIKRFATEARNILLSGVVQRLTALGFQPDGTATEKPELLGGGAVFMGEVQSEDFYHKWMSLYQRMQDHSFREVAEEAAYTWFNRLVAIRIMVKNGLIPPVLEYESEEVRIPVIVTEARQGRMPQMGEANRQKLDALLLNDALTDEQFAMLIVAYCHSNPIIRKCFGKIADYTELLLPGNILKNDGFIYRLNADDYLSDDDYRSPELIGWLYQFYIFERKDEVFAKKGKFEADEIPAATQIFTPNWIVKYMVQNTLGRIYLDNNPYSDIKDGMKYLVEPDDLTPNNSHLILDDIHDLKIADLACGSGHILNECFDLLYQIYVEEGYSRRQAVEDIFRYNLTGVDIDTRAKQLAMFALLLKACQKDRSFTDGHALPRILDMPKAGLPLPTDTHLANEIEAVNKTLADADNLGSIMKFSLSPAAYEWVASLAGENEAARLVQALTEKYSALIANPPYMGRGNMNSTLTAYLDKNYSIAKQDLFAAFMQMMIERTQDKGRCAFITMESWMFLSSFEKLRHYIIDNFYISSLGHFGWHIIGIAFGTAMTVIEKNKDYGRKGEYSYLTIDDIDRNKNVPFVFPKKDNGRFAHVSQQNFEKIPGCPIGYWVSEKVSKAFESTCIGDKMITREGMATADNDRFLRLWYEVSLNHISIFNKTSDKWYPYNKSGGFRKWFGNRDYLVNWSNDGYDIKHNIDPATGRIRSHNYNGEYAFKQCGTWSAISSGTFAIRYCEEGFLWDSKGASGFSDGYLEYIIGLLNSKVSGKFLAVLAPTLDYKVGDIIKVPLIKQNKVAIDSLVSQNISISKSDWDAHETSWDFEENELVRLSKEQGEGQHRLSDLMDAYKEHWTEQFLQLHANEEELNRQFIDIYGLQDELMPDVPPEEITILQQGELSFN